MRKLTGVLAILLIHTTIMAQYDIKIGDGFEKIKPGMTIAELKPLLGEPVGDNTYESEKNSWGSFGYMSDSANAFRNSVFNSGFDKVYLFSDKNPYGIWKVFTRNDTALIFNVSYHNNNKHSQKYVSLGGSVHFLAGMEKITGLLGEEFIGEIDNRNQDHMTYRYLGLSLILIDKQLTNIYLYQPVGRSATPVIPVEPCNTGEILYTSR